MISLNPLPFPCVPSDQMLAGDMEMFERTPIGWANQKLWDISEFWYSEKFRSTCVWVCGKRNVERIDWVQDYLFNKPNPILPSFYVFLVVSGKHIRKPHK